jgi:hypothetical protein
MINQVQSEYFKARKLSMVEILNYEVRSSRVTSLISNDYLQKLLGKYYAAKVKRKYRRYETSFLRDDVIKLMKKNEN